MLNKGLDALVYDNSKILILGSFPSVRSRLSEFFYAHPQNKFWGIIAEAFNEDIPQTIDEKKSLIEKNSLALWDVCVACEIKGSDDNTIKSVVPADIPTLLKNSNIKYIAVNGKKAKALFLRYYPQLESITTFLPSTSPANTRLDRGLWITALRALSLKVKESLF